MLKQTIFSQYDKYINLVCHNVVQATEDKASQVHWISSDVFDETNPEKQNIKYITNIYCCQRARYQSIDCNFAICNDCYEPTRGLTVATQTKRAESCHHEHHNLVEERDPWWCKPCYNWRGKRVFFTDEWFFRPRSCAKCHNFFVFAKAGTELPPMPESTAQLFQSIENMQIPTPSGKEPYETMMERGLKVYNSMIAKVKELFPWRLVVDSR